MSSPEKPTSQLESADRQRGILNGVYKTAILNSGLVSISPSQKFVFKGELPMLGSESTWQVPHMSLQSSCGGVVSIQAESKDGGNFKSVGITCTDPKCTPVFLDIEISGDELKRKISEQIRMESIMQLLRRIRMTSSKSTKTA